jgi:NADPH-dependent F420 reductase
MGKPKIAIIGGTGREGKGLGLRWAFGGYEILIGSRQAEKARLTADEINQRINSKTALGMENSEAIKNADICILTVIQTAHLQILESLQDVLQGKILVDATSRVDFRDPRPPDPPAAAQQAQDV